MDKPNVLFLCTGNSCRSQMAEGLLRALAGDRLAVHSAGTDPKPVHPLAVEAMSRRGIDIRAQQSKSLDQFLGRMPIAWLITVCDRASETCPRIWPGLAAGRRLHWPFDDPADATGSDEERLRVFERVRDEIEAHLRGWLAEQQIPIQIEQKEALS